MTCKTARRMLPGCLDGGLDAQGHAQVRSHLEGCPACRQELAKYRQLSALMSRAERAVAPADLALRVRLSLNRARDAEPWGRRAWSRITITAENMLAPLLESELVGFTLAMPGLHTEKGRLRPFLHSHMTAVLPAYRDRGVGRQLKLFQRQEALSRDIRLVEWTFDPMEMRNAHFNLMRLGAVARRFLPNCYGITASPLHAGLPTDRLVAEWWLNSPRVIGVLERKSLPRPEGDVKSILVPARMDEWRKTDREKAAAEQARIAGEFEKWFAQGYVAIAVENTRDGGNYLLQPYAQVREDLHADS